MVGMAPQPLHMQAASAFGGEKSIKKSVASPLGSKNLSPKLTRRVGRHLKWQAVAAQKEREELNDIGGEAAILGDMSKVREMLEQEQKTKVEKLKVTKAKARCEMEQSRPFAPWPQIGVNVVTENHTKRAKGMFYGEEFPWNEALLDEFGAEWLTKVLRKTGVLAADNEVVEVITGGGKISKGNNGAKSLFEVRYRRDDPDLDTKLFAKFPFPMTPATRTDRISSSVYKQPMDWSEINTYRLFEANMPFKTPKYYFGDISAETSNFVLLLHRIPFSEMSGPSKKPIKPYEIEGPYDKCRDWLLKGEPEEYYKVFARKISLIAGAYKAGTFAPKEAIKGGCMIVDPRSEGFKAAVGRMSVDPGQYKPNVDLGLNFFSKIARFIYPKYCQQEWWQEKFRKYAMLLNAYRGEVELWKEGEMCDDWRGLGHQNMNTDNAYFWRDENNKLDCGVLDWGGFGVNNIAHKLWWSMNMSPFETIRDHGDAIIEICINTFEQNGGSHVDFETFKMAFILTALLNFYQFVNAIPNSLKMCKASEFDTIYSFDDPRIASDVDDKSTLRSCVWVLNNGVRLLGELNADKYFDKWFDEIYLGEMQKTPRSDEEIYG